MGSGYREIDTYIEIIHLLILILMFNNLFYSGYPVLGRFRVGHPDIKDSGDKMAPKSIYYLIASINI